MVALLQDCEHVLVCIERCTQNEDALHQILTYSLT